MSKSTAQTKISAFFSRQPSTPKTTSNSIENPQRTVESPPVLENVTSKRIPDSFRFRSETNTTADVDMRESNGNEDDETLPRVTREAQRNRVREKLGGTRNPKRVIEEVDDDGSGLEPDEVQPEVALTPKKRKTASSAAITSTSRRKGKGLEPSLTPLEQQVVEIRSENKDVLLVVEVGYKFRFFGEDAEIASKELNIVAYMDHSMMTCSIPVHRLHVHVEKLVHLGHKVGVVRQIETAALKAAGDNRGGPFIRKLTNIYTKGTYIEQGVEELTTRSSYVMSINEVENKSKEDAVDIAIMGVQLSTGDFIYDSFQDNFMRSELETRIQHIQPTEILLPQEGISSLTERQVVRYTSARAAQNDTVRVERPGSRSFSKDPNDALNSIIAFLDSVVSHGGTDTRRYDRLEEVRQLPKLAWVCLNALLVYLKAFGLEDVLCYGKKFVSFLTRGHMMLNAKTLESLEIFHNQTDGTEKGSLLWVLDNTVTRFGGRLLKKWVMRPLVDAEALRGRTEAVQELIELGQSGFGDRWNALLRSLPDLEKNLCRIQYKRCSPSELVITLNAFASISSSIPAPEDGHIRSAILKDVYASLPACRGDTMYFLGLIDSEAASRDSKEDMFSQTEQYPDVAKHKKSIHEVEEKLQDHLKELRREFKGFDLSYNTVSQIEYLLEVRNTVVKKVPADWVKMSGTKALSRFHTPFIIEKLKEREQARELLAIASDVAFRDFLRDIAMRHDVFRDVVQNLAVLDCLLSLVKVTLQPGYTKPTMIEGEHPFIRVRECRHPMIEKWLTDTYVPNDIDLSHDQRCLLLTGPNMGGKSCYTRQVALIVIMAQIGAYIPAESAELGIYDGVFTRMGASDNVMRGQSTFMRELGETAEILVAATDQSLIILDELGRGTSTHDGTAIAYAVLKYIIETKQSQCLFVTHYPVLGTLAGDYLVGLVRLAHMGFLESKDDEETESIVFLYKLTDGLAHRSYGLNVARLANLDASILRVAADKSAQLESRTKLRRTVAVFRDIMLGMDHVFQSGRAKEKDVDTLSKALSAWIGVAKSLGF
ncbi:DNA mismatch repair protein msh3 [Cladochytrium replicatum]|nr:DNA mismatch repair protein msh3 [Cladochytrium replicatum]